MKSCSGCIDEKKYEVFTHCQSCKLNNTRPNYIPHPSLPKPKVYCVDCKHFLSKYGPGLGGWGYRDFCLASGKVMDSYAKQYIEYEYCADMNRNNHCSKFEKKLISLKPKKPWWKFWD